MYYFYTVLLRVWILFGASSAFSWTIYFVTYWNENNLRCIFAVLMSTYYINNFKEEQAEPCILGSKWIQMFHWKLSCWHVIAEKWSNLFLLTSSSLIFTPTNFYKFLSVFNFHMEIIKSILDFTKLVSST